jgi:hypothetical protein
VHATSIVLNIICFLYRAYFQLKERYNKTLEASIDIYKLLPENFYLLRSR